MRSLSIGSGTSVFVSAECPQTRFLGLKGGVCSRQHAHTQTHCYAVKMRRESIFREAVFWQLMPGIPILSSKCDAFLRFRVFDREAEGKKKRKDLRKGRKLGIFQCSARLARYTSVLTAVTASGIDFWYLKCLSLNCEFSQTVAV